MGTSHCVLLRSNPRDYCADAGTEAARSRNGAGGAQGWHGGGRARERDSSAQSAIRTKPAAFQAIGGCEYRAVSACPGFASSRDMKAAASPFPRAWGATGDVCPPGLVAVGPSACTHELVGKLA